MKLPATLLRLVRESDRALRLDPACMEARAVRGAARVLLGRPAAAVLDLAAAAAAQPAPQTFFWLSEAYLRTGRPSQGLEAVTTGLLLRGDYLAGHLLRALCRLELGQEGWEESWRHVRERLPGRLLGAAGRGAPRAQMRRILEAMGADRSLPAPWQLGGETRARDVRDFRDPVGLAAAALGPPGHSPGRSRFSSGAYPAR